jgi:crossover junction endodeoxyribonuclease RuvC
MGGLLSQAEKMGGAPAVPAPKVFRCMGIDPGLASTGWGIVDVSRRKLVYRAHGCISTKAGEPLAERLLFLSNQLNLLMDEWRPTVGAMEELFFSKNVTSALKVAEAKGVLRLCFAQRGLELAEYKPSAIKQAIVGSGRADKSEMQEFIRLILGLKEIPKPDHAADALGMAVCHIHSRNLA